MSLNRFVLHRVQTANPLIEQKRNHPDLTISQGWSSRQPMTDEQLEELWKNLLFHVALIRLAPLGGIHLGVSFPHQAVCIALTSVGRYLLEGVVAVFSHPIGSKHSFLSGKRRGLT